MGSTIARRTGRAASMAALSWQPLGWVGWRKCDVRGKRRRAIVTPQRGLAGVSGTARRRGSSRVATATEGCEEGVAASVWRGDRWAAGGGRKASV